MPENDHFEPSPGAAPRGGDRRLHDRRGGFRVGGADRRHRDRRRAAAGGLLLTGLSLAGALHGRGTQSTAPTTSATDQAQPVPKETAPAAKANELGPFEDIIREASLKYGVDVDLVRAVVQTESNFNPLAKSRAGASGLMQLMPRLSKELGITNPFDPRENVFGGTQYLSKLLDRHDGNAFVATVRR